jgi:AbrB family looped-hinge helix DNA binding protein
MVAVGGVRVYSIQAMNSLVRSVDMPSALATVKVTRKGSVAVPRKVQAKLGVKPGDHIEFVEDRGEVRLRKRVSSSPFDRYVGYLRDKAGQDPDKIVQELRGHE